MTTSGLAGQFRGAVLVQGAFTVTGTKSAAVPLLGGKLGRTYPMECPESWLADACLFVTNRTSQTFDVRISSHGSWDRDQRDDRESDARRIQPPAEPIRVIWWVIARRKDIRRPRFDEVKVPPLPRQPRTPPTPAQT